MPKKNKKAKKQYDKEEEDLKEKMRKKTKNGKIKIYLAKNLKWKKN